MSFGRKVVVAALVGSIFASVSGCTRTITRRAARFELAGDTPSALQPVGMPGVWKVKVRAHGEDDYHGIDGTERYLQEGDVVGFRTGDDGVVYAVANKEEIPLHLTEEHRRVVWLASVEQPTGLGLAASDAAAASDDVAKGALLVGLLGGLLWLALTDKDDCDDGRHSKRRKKRH